LAIPNMRRQTLAEIAAGITLFSKREQHRRRFDVSLDMKRLAFLVVLVAAVCAAPAQAGVSKTDRAAVNALLDKFIPDVVAGKDLRAGKALVGGYVSVDTIQRYPAEGTRFHGWLLNYATPGDVGFDIVVQPVNKKKTGAWSFRGEAQKVHGVWKIVDWYSVAQYQPVGKKAFVVGPNDFSPNARGGVDTKDTGLWIYVPLMGLGVLAVIVGAFGLRHWVRTRSRVRAIERALARSR
jgi:hypothetical protein